jgi:hypothetical protein
MFERIIVRSQSVVERDNPVDLGALVEAMLFYGSTYCCRFDCLQAERLGSTAPHDIALIHASASARIRLSLDYVGAELVS